MDRERLIKMYKKILKFLSEKGKSSTKEIWLYLKNEDKDIPDYSYFTRLIKLLAGDPGIIYSATHEYSEGDSFLKINVLESRKEGKELIWSVKKVELYSIPKRLEDEVDFWNRFNLLEERYSPSLVRLSLSEDIEKRIISFIIDVCRNDNFIKMLLNPRPSQILDMCINTEGFINSLPEIFREAATQILLTYAGILDSTLPSDTVKCWNNLSEILKERELSDSLFVPVNTTSISEDILICATDASKITSSFLSPHLFKIYLAFGLARSLKDDHQKRGYTYTSEPPLNGELLDPGLSKVWHETDYESDEYERRMERALLNRIHYILDSRILMDTGVWHPNNREIIPDIILHDGRLVPELFRPWDFMVSEDRETDNSREKYARINRQVVVLFDQVFSKNNDKILGVVKNERLPFLTIILSLYLLLYIRACYRSDKNRIQRFVEEYCNYIIQNKNKPLFYLRMLSIFGMALNAYLGKPVRTSYIFRPLTAYARCNSEKLEELIKQSEVPTEIKKFYIKVYLPLLNKGGIISWYIFPNIPKNFDFLPDAIKGGLCFPRFEIFVHTMEQNLSEEFLDYLCGILCSQGVSWDFDKRHSEDYLLMLPSDLVSVDLAAIQGNKDLERKIFSKFFEIKRLARDMGLIA